MKINSLSVFEALKALNSSTNGISESEAARRFSETGPNEIRESKKAHLIFRFIGHFTHFLAILLWIASILALISEWLNPGEGMLLLGLAIIGVIIINAVFTIVQEYRAEKAIEALKRLLPYNAKVIRNGNQRQLHASALVPGDIIILEEGDRIPADCRLIRSTELKVNNASLTGESEPLLRNVAPYDGELLDSPNIVFAGTTVVSGSGTGLVFATGMATEFGRIAHLTTAVESGLSPLQEEIVRTTRIIASIAAVIGIAFFLIGHFIGRSFWENFVFAIGVIVALVPEGMLPTVTLSLAMASQRMAKRNALIKNLASVETLGCVTVICTDKTGTITQNKMDVSKVWSDNRIIDAAEYEIHPSDILTLAALNCNNARFSNGQYHGDPTETALLQFAAKDSEIRQAVRIAELPFDSERKRMTTMNKIGNKEYIFTKGAMESVLPLCSQYSLNGDIYLMNNDFMHNAIRAYQGLMDMGLRVLAFAYKDNTNQKQDGKWKMDVSLESDLTFVGLIGLEDPPRPEVPDALQKCHAAGIRVIMITGDGSRTAIAIGREIGLVKGEPVIVEGAEFIKMSDRDLREKLTAREIIFARMTPKHKMRVVSILKEEGERVAVTGDGVNDAPALKKADIGIAMGISGTDVAKEASDMILLDDNFATIVNAIEEGRAVYENIRKFITYIFTSNIPEIIPYIAYVLFKIPLPITIMQILAVDLGTDILPALALGAERPTKGIMNQPPRPSGERLLNSSLLGRAYLFLGPMEAVAGMSGFFFVLFSGGWQWNNIISSENTLYMQATTACLTAIVITQVANVFVCRSSRESVFSIGFLSNKMVFYGIAFELALQFFIVYHPWGNRIFGTQPISLNVWLALIPFAFILFIAEEVRKKIERGF